MIFLPRPSSEHPHSRPAWSGWFSFSDLKYFQRLCCSTALCPRFPPLKTNSPTWPAWASCTPWRVPDYAGPLGRTSWSTVKTRTAILNSSWLSTTSRLAGRTSYHWRRASRSVLRIENYYKEISTQWNTSGGSGSLWSNNHYKAWFLNVILLRVLHIEWSRKVTVIYHNSDLDDYFGRHRQNRRKKFSPLSKLKRPVQKSVWSYEIFDISEFTTGGLVVTEAKLFPIKCRVPRAGFCQQCHITI